MKKLLSILVMAALLLVPAAFANNIGDGFGIEFETEDFEPLVYKCSEYAWTDDPVEYGRNGDSLQEREQNYAFAGEFVTVEVAVVEKNGIEKLYDVYVTVDGNIEANCMLTDVLSDGQPIPEGCFVTVDEEVWEYAPADNIIALYTCTLTVEPGWSGEMLVDVVAEDLDGMMGDVAEDMYWHFNPFIGITTSGDIDFGTVRPGTYAFTDEPVIIRNVCEGGVRLDMFISGTDFYDPENSGAKCPTSNVLLLENINYWAHGGVYSTDDDTRADSNGYVPIAYGDMISQAEEIICTAGEPCGYNARPTYSPGNVLTPDSEIAMTFRLYVPEPCNGDFSDGDIFVWAEAV